MMTATVTVRGAREGAQRLELLPRRIQASLREAMERETADLRDYVMRAKLSGQVLNPGSGALAQSLRDTVTEDRGSIRGSVGSNLRIARLHEYGGVVQVPALVPRTAQALHFVAGGADVFVTHTRPHLAVYRERSFLRTALAERAMGFVAAVRDAIAQAISER